jgi:hypothetical protein
MPEFKALFKDSCEEAAENASKDRLDWDRWRGAFDCTRS